MKTKDCVILVPVSHHIEPQVDQSLRVLESRGYKVWRVYGYSAIDQGRCKMACDAINAGFKETFWIDADVGFNPDDVTKLRAHKLPISCAVYPVKAWGAMTSQFVTSDDVHFGKNGGLRKLKFAATGFLHVRVEVYKNIISKLHLPEVMMWGDQKVFPLFMPMLKRIGLNTQYLGEDYAFSERAREAGYTIWADTTIPLQHWGSYPYKCDDVSKAIHGSSSSTMTSSHPYNASIAL